MNAEQRHQRILEALTTHGRVEVGILSSELAVSEMTIRRDLALLEGAGALRRVHRGAVRTISGSYEPPFAARANLNVSAKRHIAESVSRLIGDGETIILDGGSTGVAIAEALVNRAITVCTPSLRVAQTLASSSDVRLMVTGGILRPGEQTFVGASAARTLADHRFDLFVMTASGLSVENGCTEWNLDDAEVKRAALQVAARCIVACDASKIGRTAFARVCAIDQVDRVVTDTTVNQDVRSQLTALGIHVDVA